MSRTRPTLSHQPSHQFPRFDEAEDRLDAVIPCEGANGQFQTMSPTPKALETLKAQDALQPKKARTRKRAAKPVATEAEGIPS